VERVDTWYLTAKVLEVITGEVAQKNGVGVMVILKERDVSKMD